MQESAWNVCKSLGIETDTDKNKIMAKQRSIFTNEVQLEEVGMDGSSATDTRIRIAV